MEVKAKKRHYNDDGKLVELDISCPTGKAYIKIIASLNLQAQIEVYEKKRKVFSTVMDIVTDRQRELVSFHWTPILCGQKKPGPVDEQCRKQVLMLLNEFAREWIGYTD